MTSAGRSATPQATAGCSGSNQLEHTTRETENGDAVGGWAVEYVLTRSVRDSAALLDAISGPSPGDPHEVGPPPGPFTVEVGAHPGRLRVAYTGGDQRRITGSQLRAAVLGQQLATAVGAGAAQRATAWWTSALRFLGCTGHAFTLLGSISALWKCPLPGQLAGGGGER
jgi:hypothetical protein